MDFSDDQLRRYARHISLREIGGTGQPKGKISCMDQRVAVPGMTLPVH